MAPPNPTTATVDSGRIAFSAVSPEWCVTEIEGCYCVPLIWVRPLNLPAGRELEACVLWSSAKVQSASWNKDPNDVLGGNTPAAKTLQSLMYPARLDRKGRLCCGLLTVFADVGAVRAVWIAQEQNTVSIWTSVAFQHVHSNIELD